METYQNMNLVSALKLLKIYRDLSHEAIERVNEDDLYRKVSELKYSMSELTRMMIVNISSRWPIPVMADQSTANEEEDRLMLSEMSKSELIHHFEKYWNWLINSVEQLIFEDLGTMKEVDTDAKADLTAIKGQLLYIPDQVGQLVYLSKMFQQGDWNSISLPRGKYQELYQMKVKV